MNSEEAERSMRVALDDLTMPLGVVGWESCAKDIITAAPVVLAELGRLRAIDGTYDDTRRYVADRLADARAEVAALRADYLAQHAQFERVREERDALRSQIARVEAVVAAWPDGGESRSEYAAARGQCKRAVVAALASPVGEEQLADQAPTDERCEHGWTQPHNQPVEGRMEWRRCPGPVQATTEEPTPQSVLGVSDEDVQQANDELRATFDRIRDAERRAR